MTNEPLSTTASASDFGSEDTGSTPVGAAINEHFLILHKVRGEPAFDIATNIGSDSDGDIWIIPTSGHRAYPVWVIELGELDIIEQMIQTSGLIPPFTIDPDWPDHYTVSTERSAYKGFRKSAVTDLLSRIGLNKRPKLVRRPYAK